MDITLERILSLIPHKPDGKFVHGEKGKFLEKIGAPENIISEWIKGKNKSYKNYLYAVSAEYKVSMDWLLGKTDIKEAPAPSAEDELADKDIRIIARAGKKMTPEQRENLLKYAQFMFPEAFEDDT